MLATVRHDRILALLHASGAVRIADLAADLDVSEMTVRRDLAELAERGLLRKVHGGAVSPDLPRPSDEPGFAAKSDLMAREKQAIARAAADLVEPGASIAVSAGTTTHALARELVRRADLRPLTVVTNSLPVAETLFRVPGVTTVLTGGERTPSDALVGPVAEAALAGLHVDVAFLGAHGVSAEHGLTTPNLAEAATDRALRAAAGTVAVLADHSKWRTTGLSRWARLDDVDVLVTDEGLAPADRDAADALVGRLVVAEVAR